jgi:serine/threonine-protein kinase RsbW
MAAPPTGPIVASFAVPNDPRAVEGVETALSDALDRLHYPKASNFAVRLAFHEALSNSFRHGHRALPPSTPVRVHFEADPASVSISIEDQGPGFDPDAVPDPTTDENLERGSGRGLLLIRAYMSDVRFEGRGNRVRLLYRRP